MRSIKNIGVDSINGYKLVNGKLYLIEFPDRISGKYYIFKYAGYERKEYGGGNYIRIMHKDKWVIDFNFNRILDCDGDIMGMAMLDENNRNDFGELMVITKYDGDKRELL